MPQISRQNETNKQREDIKEKVEKAEDAGDLYRKAHSQAARIRISKSEHTKELISFKQNRERSKESKRRNSCIGIMKAIMKQQLA